MKLIKTNCDDTSLHVHMCHDISYIFLNFYLYTSEVFWKWKKKNIKNKINYIYIIFTFGSKNFMKTFSGKLNLNSATDNE